MKRPTHDTLKARIDNAPEEQRKDELQRIYEAKWIRIKPVESKESRHPPIMCEDIRYKDGDEEIKGSIDPSEMRHCSSLGELLTYQDDRTRDHLVEESGGWLVYFPSSETDFLRRLQSEKSDKPAQ